MAAKDPFEGTARGPAPGADATGDFVDLSGERYYAIRNVDRMPPFFVSVISNDDHWLFVSSTGGLSAGRVSPETSLFPYITVDKIHDSTTHTGSFTMLRVRDNGEWREWQPFAAMVNPQSNTSRNLYKNLLGNKLCFEEINHDLHLTFRYTWLTSDRYGFVRQCELENLGERAVHVELADGLQNILPAGTPRFTQTNSSNLVTAYKWTELDRSSDLALFTLYSGISDRAEPCESLRANVAYCLGFDERQVLISSEQLQRFRHGQELAEENLKRGVRGAFIVTSKPVLEPGMSKQWLIVANTELSQSQVVDLRHELADAESLETAIRESVGQGSDALARIMASGDAFQTTEQENVTTHHYANVQFNVLRGGVFADQYSIGAHDLRHTIRFFNRGVYETHSGLLEGLPDRLTTAELLEAVRKTHDPQLQRLCYEYLPITFGRRHGDPSRPWNQFAIRLRDMRGDPLLSYEGNWRDIFQNWEALAFSFPEFTESMVAKFVNASTVDGYNPYRITKEGIDWEVENPEDPWSHIGYWGDHQIIYLLKLLELSRRFHPQRLGELLHQPIFCYANVPYRIRSFQALLDDPKTTVDYDDALAKRIEQRVAVMGADGKLLLADDERVYQVNLLEKLLVPLLSKLGNLVIDGGVWMNTQRPEWNDANNALVGQGLSMVTLYYLRRYVTFVDELLDADGNTQLSTEVAHWLTETATALRKVAPSLGNGPVSPDLRLQTLTELGEAADRYRQKLYERGCFSGTVEQSLAGIRAMLADAKVVIDQSITTNRGDDGLYHAYNLLDLKADGVHLERLYPMLEGQVSALSAGSLQPEEAAAVLEALFESEVYRPDQQSFMLYPDRDLPTFLEKNRIPRDEIAAIPLVRRLLDAGDDSIVTKDADGDYRFNADFVNGSNLTAALDRLAATLGQDAVEPARRPLAELYERVFNHQAFTGRSGTMFGFEGLGCVYWHMVAKLLLAVQENFFAAAESGTDSTTLERLGGLYYRVRHGIGFNKTPAEFGAFPTDPYSHTPKHSGARQPGMTGQVKEEILTRFGELGVRVSGGRVRFMPCLLRPEEFVARTRSLRYVDVRNNWDVVEIPKNGLAFTWCQIPIIYTLASDGGQGITATMSDDKTETFDVLELPPEHSAAIFARTGRISRIDIRVPAAALFTGYADWGTTDV